MFFCFPNNASAKKMHLSSALIEIQWETGFRFNSTNLKQSCNKIIFFGGKCGEIAVRFPEKVKPNTAAPLAIRTCVALHRSGP